MDLLRELLIVEQTKATKVGNFVFGPKRGNYSSVEFDSPKGRIPIGILEQTPKGWRVFKIAYGEGDQHLSKSESELVLNTLFSDKEDAGRFLYKLRRGGQQRKEALSQASTRQ